MATSAPLSATRRLMDYSVRLWVAPPRRRGSPIYSASPFTHAVVRTPVVPATAFDHVLVAGSAFAKLAAARRPRYSHNSGTSG